MVSDTRVSKWRAGGEALQTQLTKVLASNVFSRSARMSRFLRFIAGGAGTDLKEYAIALAVFDRPSNFDPRIDPIVRVEARRLRQKLAEYYATTGQADPIEIYLPKGSYVPDFRSRETVSQPLTTREMGPQSRSVVVLPFLNLSGDSEKDYFADGLSEELTTVLAQMPDLHVIARTSAFVFRGKNADVREIGRKLNVGTVVEGSIRWSAFRLRVTVQMADCRDGFHIFAESFDVDDRELLALQNEIAQIISDALVPHFADRETRVVPRTARLVDPEAHRLYLRARYHWHRRRLADFKRAIDYCEKAIAIQPDYAEAYACIADAYWTMNLEMLAPPSLIEPRARAAASRALELDPNLAAAQATFGLLCMFDLDHERGGEHMRRAIELEPSYATAHYLYSCNLAVRGRLDESLSELRKGLELDPLSMMLNRVLIVALSAAGEFEKAVAQAKDTIELDPGFYGTYLYLAWAYMGLREHNLAIEALERARVLGGTDPVLLGYIAASKALLGQREDAVAILRQLLDRAKSDYVPELVIAVAYMGLGETERALDFLERAAEGRAGTVLHLRYDSFFLPLHGTPRFENICRSLNLA